MIFAQARRRSCPWKVIASDNITGNRPHRHFSQEARMLKVAAGDLKTLVETVGPLGGGSSIGDVSVPARYVLGDGGVVASSALSLGCEQNDAATCLQFGVMQGKMLSPLLSSYTRDPAPAATHLWTAAPRGGPPPGGRPVAGPRTSQPARGWSREALRGADLPALLPPHACSVVGYGSYPRPNAHWILCFETYVTIPL